MLGDLLAQNGLGDPQEYLNPDAGASGFALALARRVSAESYLERLRSRHTVNGWFGMKVMPHWLPAVTAACELPQRSAADTLRHLVPDARYILIKRRDIVGAAVSTALSLKSGNWQEPAPADLSVTFAEIHDNLVWLRECEDEWHRILADAGVSPLTLHYEDVVSSPGEAIASVVQHLDVKPTGALVVEARTPLLRDARSAELAAGYLEWLETLQPETAR